MKKTILTLLLFCSTISNTYSQEWHTDFETVKKIVVKEHKANVLVFQGWEWCDPCIKLDKNIWSSQEFISSYSEHFVLLQADFPRKKKNALPEEQAQKNKFLADTYNKNGYFPLVVVLDAKGTVLGETGYKKTTPNDYLQSLIAFLD